MDIIEFVGEEPRVFSVVYFEVVVCWGARRVSINVCGGGEAKWYNSGWMGERSVPITCAEGNSVANAVLEMRPKPDGGG